tara:strand:- start:334 stop:558 length:225 start_codon:yes stop_codon:yes gene_type:complete
MSATSRYTATGKCEQCQCTDEYNFGEFGATEACRFCDAAPIDIAQIFICPACGMLTKTATPKTSPTHHSMKCGW